MTSPVLISRFDWRANVVPAAGLMLFVISSAPKRSLNAICAASSSGASWNTNTACSSKAARTMFHSASSIGRVMSTPSTRAAKTGVSRVTRMFMGPLYYPREVTTMRKTITGTGGMLLLQTLKDAGVEYLFTNPGSAETGIFAALAEAEEHRLVVGEHEGLVAAMADGYHRVSGMVGVVIAHVMGGSYQLAGQLFNAQHAGSALVVIAGDWASELQDFRGLAPHPGLSQAESMRPLTKDARAAYTVVADPKAIPVATARALREASTPPTGPVYLSISASLLNREGLEAEIGEGAGYRIEPPAAARPQTIETIARRLGAAQCDVKTTLQAVIEALTRLHGAETVSGWAKRREKVAAYAKTLIDREEKLAREHEGDAVIHPAVLEAHLADVLPRETVMVQESSTARTTLLPFGHGGMTWTRSGGGSLGFGVGAAIGAKIAGGRERPVVLLLGDGALGYSAMGFWTMARYKTAMLIVVSNNESYQIGRNNWAKVMPDTQMVRDGKDPGPMLGAPMVDHVGLARAQGVEGEAVTKAKELETALRRGLERVTKENQIGRAHV